jgi:hypothetical protein
MSAPTPPGANVNRTTSIAAVLEEPAPVASGESNVHSKAVIARRTREQLIADLELAKNRYPLLQSLKFENLGLGFAQWLDVDKEIPVWVTTNGELCKKDVLLRQTCEPLMVGAGESTDTALCLTLLGCRQLEPDEQGRKRRKCSNRPVEPNFLASYGQETETLIDGAYQTTEGWASGDPIENYGVLSSLTPSAARYRGRAVAIVARCHKAVLGCANGAYHACNTCVPLQVSVTRSDDDSTETQSLLWPISGVKEPCNEPCPEVVPNPEQSRLSELNRLDLWILASDNEPFAGIYRNASECWKDASKFRKHGAKSDSFLISP